MIPTLPSIIKKVCPCLPQKWHYTISLFCFISYNDFLRFVGYSKYTHWSRIPDTPMIIGGQPLKALGHLKKLLNDRVGMVIDLTQAVEKSSCLSPVSSQDYEKAGIIYHNLPCNDFDPVPFEILQTAIKLMNAFLATHPNDEVLIHCKRGKGRSVSVALSYLFNQTVHNKKFSNEQIPIIIGNLFERVKTVRPIIDVNIKQLMQVVSYVQYIYSMQDEPIPVMQ